MYTLDNKQAVRYNCHEPDKGESWSARRSLRGHSRAGNGRVCACNSKIEVECTSTVLLLSTSTIRVCWSRHLCGDDFALGVWAATEADDELRTALADAAAELERRRVLVLMHKRLDALPQNESELTYTVHTCTSFN